MELTPGEKVKIDSKDKKVLVELQKNARLSIAQISKHTKLPRDVVVYRIKKLEQNKVIRTYHTLLNPQMLGFPLYVYAFLSCYNIKPEEETKVINYLKSHNHVIYLAKSSGKYDFAVGICAKNYNEFDNIVREIRQKLTDIIKDIEFLPIIQEYKYDWMVDLI